MDAHQRRRGVNVAHDHRHQALDVRRAPGRTQVGQPPARPQSPECGMAPSEWENLPRRPFSRSPIPCFHSTLRPVDVQRPQSHAWQPKNPSKKALLGAERPRSLVFNFRAGATRPLAVLQSVQSGTDATKWRFPLRGPRQAIFACWGGSKRPIARFKRFHSNWRTAIRARRPLSLLPDSGGRGAIHWGGDAQPYFDYAAGEAGRGCLGGQRIGARDHFPPLVLCRAAQSPANTYVAGIFPGSAYTGRLGAAAVPNFLAADISFEAVILLGLLVGPGWAMLGGAVLSGPRVLPS